FFQAEDGIRDGHVTGVQTCALPISLATAPLKASRYTVSGPVHFHLDASDAEPIAGGDGRLPNSFVVDVSPVRAREVDDFEGIVARRNPAVQAGNERDVKAEIGSRRAADGIDRGRRVAGPRCG